VIQEQVGVQSRWEPRPQLAPRRDTEVPICTHPDRAVPERLRLRKERLENRPDRSELSCPRSTAPVKSSMQPNARTSPDPVVRPTSRPGRRVTREEGCAAVGSDREASAWVLTDAEVDGFIEDGYVFVRNAVDS
jgi:hypothetical protein